MPHKGFFTQSACILLDSAVPIQRIAEQLKSFRILKQDSPQQTGWIGGGDYLIIDFRDEVNGRLLVDIVSQPWPDSMGNPKTDLDLFGAWSMGHFGPFVFPGNLQRALQHSYRCPELRKSAPSHSAFIRLRTSYVLGADKDALVMPTDYKPLPELLLITDAAEKLLELPEAICYFNPNGETLFSLEAILKRREHYARIRSVPVDLWCNARNYTPNAPGWFLIDLVGMQQLDHPDLELYGPKEYDRSAVATFGTEIAIYLAENGPIIELHNTSDGPGGCWRLLAMCDAITAPPRPVMRWFPDGVTPPDNLLPTNKP